MFNDPAFTSLTSTRKLIALFLQATPGQYTHKQIWEAIGTTDRSVTNALNCPDFRARFCQCLGVKKMHPDKPVESKEVKNIHPNEGEKTSPKPDLWRKNFTPPDTPDDTRVKKLHPGKVKNIHPPPKPDTPETQSQSPITDEGEKTSPPDEPRTLSSPSSGFKKERKKEYADRPFNGGVVIGVFCDMYKERFNVRYDVTGKTQGTGKELAKIIATHPEPLEQFKRIVHMAFSGKIFPFDQGQSKMTLPMIRSRINELQAEIAPIKKRTVAELRAEGTL